MVKSLSDQKIPRPLITVHGLSDEKHYCESIDEKN